MFGSHDIFFIFIFFRRGFFENCSAETGERIDLRGIPKKDVVQAKQVPFVVRMTIINIHSYFGVKTLKTAPPNLKFSSNMGLMYVVGPQNIV